MGPGSAAVSACDAACSSCCEVSSFHTPAAVSLPQLPQCRFTPGCHRSHLWYRLSIGIPQAPSHWGEQRLWVGAAQASWKGQSTVHSGQTHRPSARHRLRHQEMLLALPQASATLPDAPPLPWKPLLSPGQLRRGLAFYGSGRRIERVAARLLAGQAITAVTLGGSVTIGAGSTRTNVTSYAPMFFQFLNSSFPHRWAGARWRDKGCPGPGGGRQSVGAVRLAFGRCQDARCASLPATGSMDAFAGVLLAIRFVPGSASYGLAPCPCP